MGLPGLVISKLAIEASVNEHALEGLLCIKVSEGEGLDGLLTREMRGCALVSLGSVMQLNHPGQLASRS